MIHDMPAGEFRRIGYEVVDWIANYLEDPRKLPVLTRVQPGELTDQLPLTAPEQGEPMEAILADFRNLIVPSSTLWNHPHFFNFFAVSTSGPGILAEALAATLNMNGMLWKSSPAVTELEQVTLSWLRQWLGLPDSFFGMIHDTASSSTFHAVLAARAMADPSARTEGASPRFTVYFSEQAHSSVEKAALALGIGQQQTRKIPLDDQFRMRPDLLEDAIRADIAAGLKPCCVIATVGTTSTTAVDPVPAIADICARYDIWLHVDGAYGGHAGIVPEYRHFIEGCERAHSMVINPHKWLFTPIDISVFYTRHPEVLRDALSLVPEYLRSNQNERALNYMDYGVPLGRRFRALKLWFVMRYFGHERITALIRNHIQMTRELAAEIERHPWFELTAPVPMSLICFRMKGDDERTRQLHALLDTAGVFLGQTVIAGKFSLRWAIGNIHTTPEDLRTTWNTIVGQASACAKP
jgi:aromatic-L-amino-acid decarboxylase